MKKILLTSTLLFFISITVIDCSKKSKDTVDCIELANKADAAGTAYSLDPTPAKCSAYKTALTNFRNCPALTTSQRQQIDAVLPLLTC